MNNNIKWALPDMEVKMKKKLLAICLAVIFCFAALSVCATAAENDAELEAKIASYSGKKVSLIGDSISTYKNVSNNTSYTGFYKRVDCSTFLLN